MPNYPRMKLITQYEQIKAAMLESSDNGRPVCPVLSGDLMALAEKLGATEKTQDFVRELVEKQNHQPPGQFSGVTGF